MQPLPEFVWLIMFELNSKSRNQLSFGFCCILYHFVLFKVVGTGHSEQQRKQRIAAGLWAVAHRSSSTTSAACCRCTAALHWAWVSGEQLVEAKVEPSRAQPSPVKQIIRLKGNA